MSQPFSMSKNTETRGQREILLVLSLFLTNDEVCEASASVSGKFNTPNLFSSAFLKLHSQSVIQLQRNHSHFKRTSVTLPLLPACEYPLKVGSHNKGLLGEESTHKKESTPETTFTLYLADCCDSKLINAKYIATSGH